MYEKDKKNRITLRLNDDQFSFVKYNADTLGVSPSDFLRMVINSTMCAQKTISNLAKEQFEKREVLGRENDENNKHNIV